MKALVEVCVDSMHSAKAAAAGGARRLEVCGSLGTGGTTPSSGLVESCLELHDVDVMMMIRPREGDFCYDDAEVDVMRRDLRAAAELGVRGVVFGALTRDHRIDVQLCRRLIDWARPLEITFHRAFDATIDPMAAFDQLTELGVDRLLTSGQKPVAEQGIDLIRKLVEQAGDELRVIAGSGITAANVAKIVRATGVREVHASASVELPASRSPHDIQFSPVPVRVTSREKVAELLQSLADLSTS